MRRALLALLQVSVTVTLLWLVFHDPAKRSAMFSAFLGADLRWLLLGFLLCGMVEVIAGIRWRMLLRVQKIDLGWARLFQLVMIGVFFNFFAPGGTGGDMVKIFYLLKETPGRKADAFLSVLVDRMIGLFSLIVLAAVFLATRWDWLTSSSQTAQYVLSVMILLISCSLFIAASFFLTSGNLIHRLPARLPGRDKLVEFALAYHSYKRAWRETSGAFVLSVIAHFGYFGIFWCAAKSMEAPAWRAPEFIDFCAIMPMINTISSLPISLGGLGVREGLFQIFLSNLTGVTEAVAVVISTTGYLITLTWGIIGALLYMFYRPSEHAPLRKISAEVAAFEHDVARQKLEEDASLLLEKR